MEARAGIEPAHKGFADLYRRGSNPNVYAVPLICRIVLVRLWSDPPVSIDHNSISFYRRRVVPMPRLELIGIELNDLFSAMEWTKPQITDGIVLTSRLSRKYRHNRRYLRQKRDKFFSSGPQG